MTSPELTPAQRREELLAKAFDLRTFIGSLFVIFGVLVTIEGLLASDAEIEKAAGIRLSLWTGLVMLAVGLAFVGWTLRVPPEIGHGHEATDDDLPEQARRRKSESASEHPDPPESKEP